jgi:tetratricopeptide (TPR) repeat protein
MIPLTISCLRAQNLDLNKTRSVAESQHEIVMILLEKKEFAKAQEEASKIFQMKWPQSQEPVLLRELLWFSDKFLDNGQPALAVRLLETNLNTFKENSSKAAIWKEKGYLLKEMGQDDKALDCFREAQRLEKIRSRP